MALFQIIKIQKSPIKETNIHHVFHFVFDDQIKISYLNWRTIVYTEEQGISRIFGKSNDFYGGYFTEETPINIGKGNIFEKDGKYYRNVFAIIPSLQVITIKSFYDLYSRRKKSIFDPIANICSLSLTIYNSFLFLFCNYYSNNFDNYKIIEKIVTEKSKSHKKRDKKLKEIELTSNDNKNTALLDNKDQVEVIADTINEDNDEEEELELDEKKAFLPRLHFFDFFFNNIYKNNCGLIRKQSPSRKKSITS